MTSAQQQQQQQQQQNNTTQQHQPQTKQATTTTFSIFRIRTRTCTGTQHTPFHFSESTHITHFGKRDPATAFVLWKSRQ
jgi:hypothetical protein